MSRTPRCYLSSLALLSLWFGMAHASVYQSLGSIQQAAEQHLQTLLLKSASSVHLAADSLDTRLHLPACAMPLQAFLPSGANLGSRATVGVRCTSGNGWTVYVPVNIESEVKVLRLKRALARDSSISALDVDIRSERVPGTGTAYLSDVTEVQDKRAKRDLPAGTILAPGMLQAKLLIRRGQQVTILATVSGIEVRNQGVALTDGSANARIQIRNMSSAKVIEGVVDQNGVVRVVL